MNKLIFYQRVLFVFTILLLPFTCFPTSFPLINRTPYFLTLTIGYVLFLGEKIFFRVQFSKTEKYTIIFLCLFIIWMILTSIIGIFSYPFYEYINLESIDSFKNIYNNVAILIGIDELTTIKFLMIFKAIKGIFAQILYTYFISFWVYHIYKNNWQIAFRDLRNSLLILCTTLCIYSLFEINYLVGGEIGRRVLGTINPLYMSIADLHGWWPPLFWKGQLRSMFAEPSFLGMFSALAIPILLSFFFEKRFTKISVIVGTLVYFEFVIMLTLSKARTGLILFCIELVLLIIVILIFQRPLWKRITCILVCTLLSFFTGLWITSCFATSNSDVAVGSYVSQNITSVVGNKRSNSARQANVVATTKIGIQHPLFGVGLGMKDVYLDKNLLPDDRRNSEVANWSKYMYEKGPVKSGYPILNQLSVILAEQGFIGLLMFLFPVCVLGRGIYKQRKNIFYDTYKCIILISLAGIFMAFFSNQAIMPFYIIVAIMMMVIEDGWRNIDA